MSFRLWLFMMALVLFAVSAMWIVQIFVLENSHIKTEEAKLESSIDAISEELTGIDLMLNDEFLSYLGMTASEKMLVKNLMMELL